MHKQIAKGQFFFQKKKNVANRVPRPILSRVQRLFRKKRLVYGFILIFSKIELYVATVPDFVLLIHIRPYRTLPTGPTHSTALNRHNAKPSAPAHLHRPLSPSTQSNIRTVSTDGPTAPHPSSRLTTLPFPNYISNPSPTHILAIYSTPPSPARSSASPLQILTSPSPPPFLSTQPQTPTETPLYPRPHLPQSPLAYPVIVIHPSQLRPVSTPFSGTVTTLPALSVHPAAVTSFFASRCHTNSQPYTSKFRFRNGPSLRSNST